MNNQKITRTKASLFLLQGIGLSIKAIKGEGFINAYIGNNDSTKPHYSGCIYLLFKPERKQEFDEMFIGSEYMRTEYLIDEYDYPDGYVVLVYRFPPQYERDMKLFLNGKYSQFSAEYKNLFSMSIDSEDEVGEFTQHSFYYHVFNKTKQLAKYWKDKLDVDIDPEGEYWNQPVFEDEVLDIKKFINEREGNSTEVS